MGRFISSDVLVSTGQGLLGNNMFAYCENNPIIRKDESGESWIVAIAVGIAIIATINDIYQLARKDDGAISCAYTNNNESVRIHNSDHIVTPWVQYGYSFYLNHYSEYKDYFVGTTIGMTYEWTLHNAGVIGFDVAGNAMNAVGLNGGKMLEYSVRCMDVDLGPTIYHDDSATKGIFSDIMKNSFSFLYPISAFHDKYLCSIE